MTRECIICKKEVEEIHPDESDSPPWMKMWKDGVVDKIAANYGSIHDGDVFVIALCDACISENKSSIELIDNYLNQETMDEDDDWDDYVEDEDDRYISKEEAQPNNHDHRQEFACPQCGSYNTGQSTYADWCNTCNWGFGY